MANIFSVGTSGLNVAKTALSTIANNVSNSNTPGYSRQIVNVQVQPGTGLGSSFIGSGVQLGGIVSLTSSFLENNLTFSTGKSARSSELENLYSELEQAFSGAANSIGSNLAEVKSNLTTMSANPSSVPARQQFLSSLQGLSNSIQNVNSLLSQQQTRVNQSIEDSSNQINAYVEKIASLNDVIRNSEIRQPNGTILEQNKSNDLRDQRQQLINELAKYTQITTIDQPEGTTILAGGTALVVGGKFSTLAISQDPQDPTRLITSIQTQSGTVKIDTVSLGGKIGATAEFSANGISSAIANLNQYSGILGTAINDQLQKGVNLYGAAGSPLIQLDSPSVINNSNNTGTLSLNLSINAYQTQASNYQLSYTSSSGYALKRISDNEIIASGSSLPISGDGLSIDVGSGTPADGDSFLIKPFGNSAGIFSSTSNDPKALALASPLAGKASTTNSSTTTVSPIKVVSSLPLNANLTQPVSITFTSPTQYTISGTGIGTLTNQPFTSGQTISYNGWSTSLVGNPKTGDSFSIIPATNNSGDSSNANDLMTLLESKKFGNNSQTLADFAGAMQSTVGTQSSLAQTNAKADLALLNLAQNERESYSGVNLDEEAADLAKWQQIYTANAQVISLAKELFTSIINIM